MIPRSYELKGLVIDLAEALAKMLDLIRNDGQPSRPAFADGSPDTSGLPVTARHDDWKHRLFTRFSPRSIFLRENTLSIWRDELDETGDWARL